MDQCSALVRETFSEFWLLPSGAFTHLGTVPYFCWAFLTNYNCCDGHGPDSVLALEHMAQLNHPRKDSKTREKTWREVNHLWPCGRNPWAVITFSAGHCSP